MVFRKAEPTRVEAGEITAAFRRWKRPTVAAGGTLTTAIGVLGIEAVDRIDEAGITEADASQVGFPGVEPLLAELRKRSTGEHFRITFQLKSPDPRTELRERHEPDEAEWGELRTRLDRLDGANRIGPWTRATLVTIGGAEGGRTGDLAAWPRDPGPAPVLMVPP